MLSYSGKKWIVGPAPDVSLVAPLVSEGIHPVLAHILIQRGLHDPSDVREFLEPLEYSGDDNPFRMKDMTEAVYRMRMAIRRREKIVVYGDFDCDGVTSSVLLVSTLRLLGADVEVYIPDRVDEGYGLNSAALERLAEAGVNLVVTVDCGIRSIIEVEDALRFGMDVIVTDHHSVGDILPPAYAVVNPQRPDCDYPEKRLSGVGVTYKVAQALYMEARRRGHNRTLDWHPDDFLDLAALGTVADIMSLAGENRVIVRRGLNRLNSTRRIGLLALCEAAGVKPGSITATTIGFILGPRINAAGRLANARIAYDLLMTEDPVRARELANELNDINRRRQELTAQMQDYAEQLIGDATDRSLIFAHDQRFEQGIVGLVAGRLTEQYYRPSVVLQVGERESHGSCRSIPEFHITKALESCSELLIRFGGHAMAAGLTVQNDRIEALKTCLSEIADSGLQGRDLHASLEIDTEISFTDITFDLLSALAALEPTGEGNPTPLFMTPDVLVTGRTAVGAESRHLRLTLSDGIHHLDGIAFSWGSYLNMLPDRVDIVYNLDVNEWNGRRSLQLSVRDIRPATRPL